MFFNVTLAEDVEPETELALALRVRLRERGTKALEFGKGGLFRDTRLQAGDDATRGMRSVTGSRSGIYNVVNEPVKRKS